MTDTELGFWEQAYLAALAGSKDSPAAFVAANMAVCFRRNAAQAVDECWRYNFQPGATNDQT